MSCIGTSRLVRILLASNLFVWVYFWFSFALTSEPYDPHPLGHVPVDVISFFGHAIGLTRSSLTYPFMKVVFWVELPSFLLVILLQRVLFADVAGNVFFAGISPSGFMLLMIMVVSFLQWCSIALATEWLSRKWAKGG